MPQLRGISTPTLAIPSPEWTLTGTEDFQDCIEDGTCDQEFFLDPQFMQTLMGAINNPNFPACWGRSLYAASDACLASIWPNLFQLQQNQSQQPSCTISVASSGTPLNGQNFVGLTTYSPKSNVLGAYSTLGRPGAPQGWFFAVQIQASLYGDTNPADWSGTQTVSTSGSVQISLPNGTVSTYIWPLNPPQDDSPNTRAVATGAGSTIG